MADIEDGEIPDDEENMTEEDFIPLVNSKQSSSPQTPSSYRDSIYSDSSKDDELSSKLRRGGGYSMLHAERASFSPYTSSDFGPPSSSRSSSHLLPNSAYSPQVISPAPSIDRTVIDIASLVPLAPVLLEALPLDQRTSILTQLIVSVVELDPMPPSIVGLKDILAAAIESFVGLSSEQTPIPTPQLAAPAPAPAPAPGPSPAPVSTDDSELLKEIAALVRSGDPSVAAMISSLPPDQQSLLLSSLSSSESPPTPTPTLPSSSTPSTPTTTTTTTTTTAEKKILDPRLRLIYNSPKPSASQLPSSEESKSPGSTIKVDSSSAKPVPPPLPPLPPSWTEMKDPKGGTFYYHSITRKTTRVRPV